MWAKSGSDLGQISPIIWTPPHDLCKRKITNNSFQNWISIPILTIFFLFFLIDKWIQLRKKTKKIARIGILIQFWKLLNIHSSAPPLWFLPSWSIGWGVHVDIFCPLCFSFSLGYSCHVFMYYNLPFQLTPSRSIEVLLAEKLNRVTYRYWSGHDKQDTFSGHAELPYKDISPKPENTSSSP